jgi:hypothetical protein
VFLRGALVSLGLLAWEPRTAWAIPYEIFIDVEAEPDLYELLAAGRISEPTFDALLLLHQARVNLDRADRERLYLLPNLDYADVDAIIAHRDSAGPIRSLESLVQAGVIDAKVADSLRPFVLVDAPSDSKRRKDALLRVQGRWSGRYDRLPPPLAAQARIRPLQSLDIGAAATVTRNQLHRVRWDAGRRGLSAAPERTRFVVPKLYVQWQGQAWEIIVGTYRIGFGQRLTFDVTNQVTPRGVFGDYELRRDDALTLRCRRSAGELGASPCPAAEAPYVTPDYAWTNRLTGVALGVKHPTARGGWLQLYGWGSYQVHRVLQTEVVVADRCDDPRADADPQCSAPPVFVRTERAAALASEARFASLPMAYAEALAGAHVSYSWSARKRVGVTGFGAVPRWLVRGVELGFQESAAKPFGGPFGAVGIESAFGFGSQDFSMEVARSFDRQIGGGGGFGAVLRSVTTLVATEVDVSARYYGARYANPYARPVSAPDELEGLRARDESGLRLRVTSRIGERAVIRTVADAWRRLSSGAWQTAFFARLDLQLAPSWACALWVEHRHGANERVALSAELGYRPHRRLAILAQLRHALISTKPSSGPWQRDIGAIAALVARPIDILRLHLRARYDFEDVMSNHRLPQVLWGYVDVSVTPAQGDALRLRYDVRAFLDRRASTILREPNPEHWLLLEYVWRY